MKQFTKLLFAAALGGVVAVSIFSTFNGQSNIETSDSTVTDKLDVQYTNYTSSPSIPLESIDFVEASKKSVNAVVHVKTIIQSEPVYNPWSQVFGGEKYYTPKAQHGSGSGVIISGDGYIVTNNHVIDNASEIEVTMNNNRTYSAQLIGKDPATDIALLKIDDNELPAITLGDSDHLQIGEWVLAVGNPFNLTSTVTAGIVSAKARNINILDYNPSQEVFPLESFIQTDAAVNPGNSGGALVNGRGELVGINTAIASRTGSYSGYSFAVPVSIVQKVTADLLEFGKVQRAYIGVNISNIDDELRSSEDLKISEGAYVRGLVDGGAAADAGLEVGDIIVEVDNRPIRNVTELQEQVGKFRPGNKVSVVAVREGQKKQFNVTLKDRYGTTNLIKEENNLAVEVFGARVDPLSQSDRKNLRLDNGVKINALREGVLKSAGIEPGFVITHVDKQPVESPEEFSKIMKSKQGVVLIEGKHQNGQADYYAFGL
jgi:Do/DeqQ family serine protease